MMVSAKRSVSPRPLILLILVVSALGQETLEQRIETVFGAGQSNNTIDSSTVRAGFDVIVQPDPIVEPTTAPQILTTDDGERCKCVAYHQCDPNANTIRTDGKVDGFGVIDIRFNPNECQDVLDVCCKESQMVQDTVTPSPGTNTPLPAIGGCGIRNVGGIDFQLAGNTNEAGFGEFPWTVALIRIADDACLCGGSLIHPQVILTANHCVRNLHPTAIKVRAGEWDTQTTKERLPYQERTAVQAISHPNYNSKTLANDIALLVLDSPFELAEHINTICLPVQGMVSTGNKCVASGWGKDVFGKRGKYSVIMKRVELPVVDSLQCQSTLQATRLGPRFRLDPTFICAGGEPGVDTCQGDGGAPLVCPIGRENRHVQSGIVSWGIGCKENRPAVYVHVGNFRDWIDTQMVAMGFGTESFSFR